MTAPQSDRLTAYLAKRDVKPAPPPTTGPAVPPGEAPSYIVKAFTGEDTRMRAAVPGERNDTLNLCAFNLGQLVGSGHLNYEHVWTALYDAALSTGLPDREVGATLSSGLRAGIASPREVPERAGDGPAAPLSDPERAPGDLGPGPGPGEAEEDPAEDPNRCLDWLDLWAQDDDDEDWIIEPILPARRLVALYSPAKAGKSLLMLEASVGVSRGITVLGYTPDRPRRVLYVDLENDPRGDIRTRLQQMGLKPQDLGNLRYLSFPNMPMLDTFIGAAYLLDKVKREDCEVVVIDTVSRVVAGEENDNDTWLNFYRHTGRLLKSEGITCVRLDHTGKDVARGMRGGSAKYSDVDLVWSLTHPAENTLCLECTAQRLPVRERFITLHRKTDPYLHHEVGEASRQAAWVDEENDTIRWLDVMVGEQTPLGLNAAIRLLREHGRGKRKQDVSALLHERDQRLNDRGLTFDQGPS